MHDAALVPFDDRGDRVEMASQRFVRAILVHARRMAVPRDVGVEDGCKSAR